MGDPSVPLGILRGMGKPFLGSEAVASGLVTPYALRTGRFVAIHRDVYVPRDAEITAVVRAEAAWLWSRRRGVIAGRSAAALHGAKWVDGQAPADSSTRIATRQQMSALGLIASKTTNARRSRECR